MPGEHARSACAAGTHRHGAALADLPSFCGSPPALGCGDGRAL